MKAVFFVLIATLLFACNDSSEQSRESSGDSTRIMVNKAESIAGEACYLFVAAKDTYALKVNIADTAVKGTAVFRNFEKDSNHGSVEGKVEGDIIHLWYHFQSEGMSSVRELYFKKKGDQLVTGIANEATRGDTAYVPDPKTVSYSGPVYVKGDCTLVPQL